ncbi:MAG: type II secretion system protein J [Syntrophales bacterium]|jgi:prepilin-type N-terminal cleavage/methylation domain-containing protein
MKKKTPYNSGFTLIEIIVSLLILAILGVIAGRGMLEMANGYMLSKKNTAAAQLGQITVDRLKKEFSSITSTSTSPSIYCGAPNIITYTVQRNSGVDTSSIYLAGGNNLSCQHPPCIFLKTASNCTACSNDCAGGDTLAENVSNFTLSYCVGAPMPSAMETTNCSATFPNSPNFTGGTVLFVRFILKLKGYDDAVISIANPDTIFFGLESGS